MYAHLNAIHTFFSDKWAAFIATVRYDDLDYTHGGSTVVNLWIATDDFSRFRGRMQSTQLARRQTLTMTASLSCK